jgi:hypothetical protein
VNVILISSSTLSFNTKCGVCASVAFLAQIISWLWTVTGPQQFFFPYNLVFIIYYPSLFVYHFAIRRSIIIGDGFTT